MTLLVIAAVLLVAWGLVWVAWRRRVRRPKSEIRPRESRRMGVLLAVALVVLPVAAAVTAAPKVLCFGGGIDTGITLALSTWECVGTTDGSHSFSGALSDKEANEATRRRYDEVLKQIKDQNDAVSGDHVKIGFLAPLTSELSGPRVVHELAGLAAAQQNLNGQQRAPRIELVLAHMGAKSTHWESVVDDLIAMKHDSAPLVAVVGMGLSQVETKFAAQALAAAKIPMVADLVTATKLDPNSRIERFHRTSFANARQFDATIKVLESQKVDVKRAVVVKCNEAADSYCSTSADAILGKLGGQDMPYLFGTDAEDPAERDLVLGSQFKIISDKMCHKVDAKQPDAPVMLYYAGRARFLSLLLTKVAEENCLRKVIVVSASDASVLRMGYYDDVAAKSWKIPEALQAVRGSKVSLYFTPLADPVVIRNRPKFGELRAAMRNHDTELDTGWAAMSWDALHIATEWVRKAQNGDPTVIIPRPEAIETAMRSAFSDPNSKYEGASGTFYFGPDGDRIDVVEGVELPAVLRLKGDGSADWAG